MAGRLPEMIGFPIQDRQKKNQFLARLSKLRFSGAKAVNHRIDDYYICYIPGGTNDKDNTTDVPYPTSSSVLFVFDYSKTQNGYRNCWYQWDSINAASGMLSVNDELIVSSLVDPVGPQKTLTMKKTGSKYDFSDNSSPINWIYNSAWLNYSMFSTDKKWVRLSLNSIRKTFDLLVKQYFNYIETSVSDFEFYYDETQNSSPKYPVDLDQEKAMSLSIGFENNEIYQDVSINGWDIQLEKEYDQDEVIR